VISRRLLTVLALAGMALVACGRAPQDEAERGVIRFSLLSPEPETTLDKAWAPIVTDMEASTGLTVKLQVVTDGPDLVSALRHHATDFGLFSNQAGLEAVRGADGEVFARPAPVEGSDGDHAVLVVAAKSRVTLDRVLKCDHALTLGAGETRSTAASLAPETYLFAPRGLRPAKCFRQIRQAPQDANLQALAAGQVDVVATSADRLALARRNIRPLGAVREIWRSPPLPENPLIWRKDLDPAIKEKLRQFFLTYGQAGATQRARLASAGVGGFLPADNSHLLPTREMEATHVWLEAEAGGDKAKIDEARRALDAITAERLELEARTRAPAAAQ
jgi:phosphonate transport system substrate-binding protein